jgi:DNA-binding NtrC family response regulator
LKILIIDDAEEIRVMIEHFMQQAGHETICVETGQEALEQIRSQRPQIAFVDLNLPDMTGLDVMEKAQIFDSQCTYIMITAYGSIDNAVAAMKAGAFDYLTKPLNSDELIITISRVKDKLDLQNQNQFLKTQLNLTSNTNNFLSNHPKIKQTIAQAEVVADTDATILITGESGTGKEVLARFIHDHSARRDRPFVTINCSALSEQLLESELFGHVKGAFTGAQKDHRGYVEIADGGTVFLDEIGEVNQQVQVTLLNFLQDKTFSPVGDTRKIKADVRILAATNREMKGALKSGEIREDFYYRLNVFNFHLDPLRSRQEDIVLYFRKFVGEFADKMKKPPPSIGADIEHMLVNYAWPGNVRELRNVAERVTILNQKDRLNIDAFPDDISEGSSSILTSDFKASRNAFETQFITRHLRRNKGNMAATARQIGFHPVAMRKKVVQLGINAEAIRAEFD